MEIFNYELRFFDLDLTEPTLDPLENSIIGNDS